MRVGRYLPGISPDEYRSMSLYDRSCLNDALDALLSRENGEKSDEEKEAGEEEREFRIDEEARRAARLGFDGWREDREEPEDEDEPADD